MYAKHRDSASIETSINSKLKFSNHVESAVTTMMKVVIIAVIGWAGLAVATQEKVCSSFCSSLGMMQSNPGKSCDDIYQINKATRGKSGYYWINATTGVHQVYCDMELECGGHKGGWMRIANLDVSRGDSCPSGWSKITSPVAACRPPSNNAGCYPVTFTVNGTNYHRVCGKARGYQHATTDAFRNFVTKSINGAYVDGLSITLGNPRRHVWTYAAGHEDNSREHESKCPCAANPGKAAHPFIGNHYYCESGTTGIPNDNPIIYTSDPLWDGSGCVDGNNNCCTNADMPWFFRQFVAKQEDNLEARICTDQGLPDEGVLVDQLQLFVQ